MQDSIKVTLVAKSARKMGKTSVLNVCREALEKAGYQVIPGENKLFKSYSTEQIIVTKK